MLRLSSLSRKVQQRRRKTVLVDLLLWIDWFLADRAPECAIQHLFARAGFPCALHLAGGGPDQRRLWKQRILNGEPHAALRARHRGARRQPRGRAGARHGAPGRQGLLPDGGTTISEHGFGVQSVFIHMKAKIGTYVQQGEVIGHVGQTGRATGPHLHWGMNWLDVRLDPAFWVPQQQVSN
jgi:hypothetical protein